MPKSKLAIFTATGCSACENAVLDIHYQVNSLSPWAEIVFWPYVAGHQWQDLDTCDHIDVCLFAGAIRTEDDRRAALRLREKSKLMVACGACASLGGLPGLANLASDSGDQATPCPQKGDYPALPRIESRVSGLPGAVEVDFHIPGCPPPQNLLWAAIQSLVCRGEAHTRISYAFAKLPEATCLATISGELPPRGSVFAGEKAVCAGCSRVKEEKKFSTAYRGYELAPDPGRCLLEQGLICQGLATREGCGGLCTAVGAPCRGCFGKAEGVYDPGAKMVSAVSSTFDTTDSKEAEKMAEKFVDLAGTFYRYTVPEQCVLLAPRSKERDDAEHDL